MVPFMTLSPTLVTGATGLVGNNVVRQLLSRGWSVRVLARDGADPRPLAGLDVEIFRGDIRRPETLSSACSGAGAVIHAAGYVHLGRTGLDLQRAINVEGTRNVARTARQAGARMVHISSCDAAGIGPVGAPADEDTPLADPRGCTYAISKREAEQAVHEEIGKGLDAVIVNPGFMLGPWDWKPSSGRMLLEVARGRGLLAPHGWFSVCDVRDVASGIISAAERGARGRRYLMAGENTTYLAAWRLFARVSGGRRPWMTAGPAMLFLAGRGGDLAARLSGRESDVNSAAIAYARLPKNYTSRRAREELGYASRPLEETVRDAWAWFKDNGYA